MTMPAGPAPLMQRKVLCPDILLIDGLGRAGKQLVGKLVSNFERVDSIQYSAALEQFPILVFLGRIDSATASVEVTTP